MRPKGQLEKDIDSSIDWLVTLAVQTMKAAIVVQKTADEAVNKALVISACANLPGDMPLRVRCTPNAFLSKA